jgi:DNA-directed RNA polymerase specialized sigma24 family protein
MRGVSRRGSDVLSAVPVSFEASYAMLWAPMMRVAYSMVGSRAVAEELAQEAFVRIFRHFDDVERTRAGS